MFQVIQRQTFEFQDITWSEFLKMNPGIERFLGNKMYGLSFVPSPLTLTKQLCSF